MITFLGPKTTWHYIVSPKLSDLKELKEKYAFDSILLQEILIPSFRPKTEKINNHLFLALHFPIYNEKKQTVESKEIDFIVGENSIITSTYLSLKPFKEMLDEFKKDPSKKDQLLSQEPYAVLYTIIAKLLDFTQREMRYIESDLNYISEALFKNKTASIVKKIASVRNNTIIFRRVIKPQQEVIESLINSVKDSNSEKISFYFNKLLSDYLQIRHQIEVQFDTINALHDTHMALISLSTNRLMLILTAISGIIVPITLAQIIFNYIFAAIKIHSPTIELLVVIDLLLVYALIFLRLKRN